MPRSFHESIPSRRTRGAFSTTALLAMALLATGLAAQPARAQAVPDAVRQQLEAAGTEGPAALLKRLEDVLRANPSLAATPAQAAALAHAAGAPVSGFVGATLPVYRGITDRIAAAAPPERAASVREAVAAELGRMAAADVRPKPPGMETQLTPQQGAPTRQGEVAQAGHRVGSFIIYPEIQAATIYDSNVYATRTQRKHDWVGTISPRISFESDWKRHALSGAIQTDLTGYTHYGRENTVDWNANLEGRLDATNTTQIVGGATYISAHEDRTSPDDVEGLWPTPYQEASGYAGVLQRVGDFAIRLGGAVERLTFDNVDTIHGPINNHDRDRARFTYGALVRYEANPGFRPFVEVLGDYRKYDHRADDFGFQRTSNGYRAGAGAIFRISDNLRGDAFVGVLQRSAEDPTFRTATTMAFDGSLRWRAMPGTLVVLYTERSMEETTLYASPGYIYTVVGGRIEQQLTDRLTGLGRLAWGHSDFLQTTRVDDEGDASVGLRYRLTEKLTLGADYRYTLRSSNDDLAKYNRHEIYFRVGAQF